jgi:enoyl-CoA hydratase/carnithine racemase
MDGVLLEKDAGTHIARITLNNPERRNAFNPEMRLLIAQYLEEVAQDDDINVLLLRGTGGTFSTGADLAHVYNWYAKEGDTRRPSQRRRMTVDRKNMRWYHTFVGFPKATVVQAEAYALGAGFELSLMADVTVIGRGCKVGMPGAKILGPILGNIPLFFHRLGPALAKRMLLTGEIETAEQWESMGIFGKTVDDDQVADEAEAMAAKIARMPADGIHLAKEAYRLTEMSNGLANEEVFAYMFHTIGTNLRFETSEFNFVKERATRGTSDALKSRDRHYEGTGAAE